MRAMILAAGFGERMRPLTEARAKPSLPVLNRPMIVHTLDYLRRSGIREVMINLHHEPESIRGIVGDGSRLGLRVHYSEEPVLLGTAGGPKKAEAFFADQGCFILINSDFITDCDLETVVKKHRETGALATLVLTPPRPDTDYGVVEMGERERIQRIAGRPEVESDPHAGRYTFTGLHVLEPAVLRDVPAGETVEINRTVYPRLISDGKLIRGFVHSGLWRELGTPRLYIEGSIAVLRAARDPSLTPLRVEEGIYLDRVALPPNATLDPPVLLGRGASIGPDSRLTGGVVIGRQVRVGKGCMLSRTIAWDGARIGDGAELTDCIVTSGVYVPPGAMLQNKIVLRVEGYQGPKDRLVRLGSNWVSEI